MIGTTSFKAWITGFSFFLLSSLALPYLNVGPLKGSESAAGTITGMFTLNQMTGGASVM
jgi:hypothetical protein